MFVHIGLGDLISSDLFSQRSLEWAGVTGGCNDGDRDTLGHDVVVEVTKYDTIDLTRTFAKWPNKF